MSLYDRIFRPRRYTLSDGTVVEEKRSRAPLVILILVVLIGLIVIFKSKLTVLLNSIFSTITQRTGSL